ncbi:MAG: LLM class F420-dependent oxidoreductase [Candidatus Binatia bacterium]
MKLALFGWNIGPVATPETIARIAPLAESAGYESLWVGEHVVLPDPQVAPSPLPPEIPMLDPTVALTFAAAVTKRVKLGTGIIILPQRNPLVLAKELASLDVLSKGRLVFGVGIGYLKPEFDAIGAPFDHKGARTEDFLGAMKAIWTGEKASYDGRFVKFAGVRAMPRPVQQPHPEIVFGGHTPEAFDRAVRFANGWYGFAQDLDATKHCLEGLRAACAKHGRDFSKLEISITPGGGGHRTLPRVDRDTTKRFEDLGVHRLIVFPATARDEKSLVEVIEGMAKDVIR